MLTASCLEMPPFIERSCKCISPFSHFRITHCLCLKNQEGMELVELGLLPENLFGDIKLPSETIWIPTGVQPGGKGQNSESYHGS